MVLASWLSKVVLGGSLLVAGTGLSVGSILLVTRDSSPEKSVSTKEQHTDNKVESEEVGVVSQELEERRAEDTTGEASSVFDESSNTPSEEGDQNEATSENSDQSSIEKKKTEPQPKHGTCTIYKVMSSKPLYIVEAEQGFLNEIKNTTSYRKIREECDKGGNIFLSNRYLGRWSLTKEWGYYEQKDEYKRHVEGLQKRVN